MQDCRLCKAWQRLMKALDHDISPVFQRRFRKAVTLICILQMRPMRLVDDQRDPVFMSRIRDRPDIRHHAFIGWGCDEHYLDFSDFSSHIPRISRTAHRILFKRFSHVLRTDSSIDPEFRDLLRIQILRLQPVQADRMVHRLMTVSRCQDLSAVFRSRKNCT